MPLQQPAMERWFDIALLVEEAPSLGIWQKLVAEFQQLLAQHGAFRDVRRWYFQAVDGTVHLYNLSGVPCNPRQLHHPTSRRLILVISDCVSPGWYDGAIASMLAEWGAKMPVVVVQMLPEELWRHTALGPVTFALRALLPGISNKNLSVEKPAWIVESEEVTLPLPVVTLEPAAIDQWTRMVMAGGTSAPGVCLPLQPEQTEPETSSAATRQKDSEERLDPEQRIQSFRALVSPTAFKLAIYLSTLRLLTLPVMRLVQQSMLPKSQPVHLAEVFLGGLLERVTPAAEKRVADEVVYDFYQGVREILVKWVSRSEADKLIDNISAYIESHGGFDFVAYIQDVSGEVSVPEEAIPFARPFLDTFTTFFRGNGITLVSSSILPNIGLDHRLVHNRLAGFHPMPIPETRKASHRQITDREMLDQQSLNKKIDDLNRQWELLNKKLSELKEQSILETRFDEKFRLEKLIEDTETRCDQVDEQLKDMESQLVKVDKKVAGQNDDQGQIVQSLGSAEGWLHPSEKIMILVTYSHADAPYLGKNSLLGYLRGLEKDNVEFWTDREIKAGELWDDVIKAKIQEADIALVLVSQAFLDSDYCQNVGNPTFPGAEKASVSDHSVAVRMGAA